MLKPILLLPITLLFASKLQAQVESQKSIALAGYFSRHGTGDLDGAVFDFAYEFDHNRRISYHANLGFSFHGQQDRILNT
jgi:hypothetical protein